MLLSYQKIQDKKVGSLKMKEIKLTQGKVTLVDDEDYEYLNQFRWYAHKDCKTYYAIKNIRNDGKRSTITMHQKIMKTPKGMKTDHKDHDGLNNQKYNLRICSTQQNGANREKQIGCSSDFKGVFWSKRDKKWAACIGINKKSKRLGLFNSEIEAALVYNKVAKEKFGEFARINLILLKRKGVQSS